MTRIEEKPLLEGAAVSAAIAVRAPYPSGRLGLICKEAWDILLPAVEVMAHRGVGSGRVEEGKCCPGS